MTPLPKPEKPLEWEVDRHKLWRRITQDYEELKKRTPEGFRIVVTVSLRTRPKPLELGFVRTSRDPEYPWIRFELTQGVRPGEPDDKPVSPDAEWIYVREQEIERVEMKLVEGEPFDFDNFEVLEDEAD